MEKECYPPDEESSDREGMKMRVEMEDFRCEKRPEGDSVEVAASQLPEGIEGLTGCEVDLIDLLGQPEHGVLNGFEHIDMLFSFSALYETPSRLPHDPHMVKSKDRNESIPSDSMTWRASLIIVRKARLTAPKAPNAKEPRLKTEGVIDARCEWNQRKKGSDFPVSLGFSSCFSLNSG